MAEAQELQPLAIKPVLAAKMIGVSIPTLYALLNRGEIRAHKCGKRTLVRVADIEAFLDNLPRFADRHA